MGFVPKKILRDDRSQQPRCVGEFGWLLFGGEKNQLRYLSLDGSSFAAGAKAVFPSSGFQVS